MLSFIAYCKGTLMPACMLYIKSDILQCDFATHNENFLSDKKLVIIRPKKSKN